MYFLHHRIVCAERERGRQMRERERGIQVDFTIALRAPFSHALLGSRSHLQNVRFTWWAVAAPVSLDTEATFLLPLNLAFQRSLPNLQPGSMPSAMDGGRSVTRMRKRICNGVRITSAPSLQLWRQRHGDKEACGKLAV